MKCPECGEKMVSKKTIMHLVHKGETVVIENVPAMICEQCGEEWIDGKMSEKIDKLLEKQKKPKQYSLTPVFDLC